MRKKWRTLATFIGTVIVFFVLRTAFEDIVDTDIKAEPSLLNKNQQLEEHIKKEVHEVKRSNKELNRYPETLSDKLEQEIKKHYASCKSLLRPKEHEITYQNGYWQSFREQKAEILAISAFYDDRPIVGFLPFLRILAVSSRATKQKVFCHVWYPQHEHPFVVPVLKLESGRGDTFDGIKYDQLQYSCALPVSQPVPTHVSLSVHTCQTSTIYLPINVPTRSDWQHEFGICVAIAFDKIPKEQFVEWIEFHNMLGVTEFEIYDGNISPDMKDLFQYYNSKGLLNVYSMPPPVMDFTKKGVKLSSPASLNDCMLRNMYRFKYMVVIDFDEFIIPRQHSNYSAMLKAVDDMEKLKAPFQSYTFRNLYYFDHFPTDESQPKNLRTMHHREHTNPSKYLYAPKSFIDPRSCLSVFNHFCYRRFQRANPWTINVNTTVAMSHHYRTCGFDKKKCAELSKQKQNDDLILKFKPQLESRVNKVLLELS